MNIDPIVKMSSPMIDGNSGKKNIEPMINDKFPIAIISALIDPILLHGLIGEKSGSTSAPNISHMKKNVEPIIYRIPPTFLLT